MGTIWPGHVHLFDNEITMKIFGYSYVKMKLLAPNHFFINLQMCIENIKTIHASLLNL